MVFFFSNKKEHENGIFETIRKCDNARSTLQSRRCGARTSARPMVSSNVDRALIDDHVVYGVSSGEALELEVCAWNGCNVSILVDCVVVDGGI